MLSAVVELGLNHVGLGRLDEESLTTLFADVHCRQLTHGLDHSIRGIEDSDGRSGYPGYYWSHLSVPAGTLVGSFDTWSQIEVAVQTSIFGGALLSSRYAAGVPGTIPEDPDDWESASVITMAAANMFYLEAEGGGEPVPAVPRAETLARLPKSRVSPRALNRFRKIRHSGSLEPDFDGPLQSPDPISYRLLPGRDITPGQHIVFSKYFAILDQAERELLGQRVWPRFPPRLIDHLSILEREALFFGNVRTEETLMISLRARLSHCQPGFHGLGEDQVAAGVLDTVAEIYTEESCELLVATSARKLLAIPREKQGLRHEAKRVAHAHASQTIEGVEDGTS